MKFGRCADDRLVFVSLIMSLSAVAAAILLGYLHSGQEEDLQDLIRRGATIDFLDSTRAGIVSDSAKTDALVYSTPEP